MNKNECEIFTQVCIIGGGTAGMAAAYALKDTGYRVVLVEKESTLGGTAVNAWVETWIAGINPPYLKEILCKDFKMSEKDLSKIILPKMFSKVYKEGDSSSIYLSRQKLGGIYLRDMTAAANIQLMCGYRFLDACMKDSRIKSVRIQNTNDSGDIKEITADYFIDATGNGDLAAYNGSLDIDYYLGEDPYDRFDETLAPKSQLKQQERISCLNEPSLFFCVAGSGSNDAINRCTSGIPEKYRISATSDFRYDGYNKGCWVNPMTGMNISGWAVVDAGEEYVYGKAKEQVGNYWTFIQEEVERRLKEGKDLYGYNKNVLSQYPTGECASMLGIRETRRIACKYMLRQKDLAITESAAFLGRDIAMGSHDIDFHVYGHLSQNAIGKFNNEELRPSGIPYDCMIPLRFRNLLVACRSYGASHIALAARRVNKDMAQLGWAAGKAFAWCLDRGFNACDTSDVDVVELQSTAYTGFKDEVEYMENHLLKEEYKR